MIKRSHLLACTVFLLFAAGPANAGDVVVDLVNQATDHLGEVHAPISFADCYIGWADLDADQLDGVTVLRKTTSEDIKAGYLRGTLAIRRDDGSMLLELLCGNGLAVIRSTEN